MKNVYAIVAVSIGLLAVPACSPIEMAAGGGATVGVAAAQEGGIKVAVADTAIRLQIHDLWFKKSLDMYRHLDMTVKEGRVLITGSVPSPDMRVDAVRLAWQADGVKQVINEIRVDDGVGVTGYVRDHWVTADLDTRLMLDREVQSINYTVDTYGGTVYLMGIAQNRSELDRVIEHARSTRYVDNVVSYVRLRGEIPAGVLEPASD